MNRGILLAAALAAASLASAQTSPDQHARGLLEDGRVYPKEGKLKQALDNFNTIVSGLSATDSVDDALLEIGRYQMDVEKNVEKEREAFEQVTKRYPQSDGSPGAYYYRGMVTLARAAAAADIEDALAQFGRVQRLYPGSEWVPRALYASATAQRRAGRFPEALEAGRRVFLEYPSSVAAPAAHCAPSDRVHGLIAGGASFAWAPALPAAATTMPPAAAVARNPRRPFAAWMTSALRWFSGAGTTRPTGRASFSLTLLIESPLAFRLAR